MKKRLLIILSLVLFTIPKLHAQLFNYEGIDIQGQLQSSDASISLKFILIDTGETVVWEEDHNSIILYEESTFQMTLGQGTYVLGSLTEFYAIDWRIIDRVEIWRIDGSTYQMGEFDILTVPYSYHSLTIEYIPNTFELTDLISMTPIMHDVIRFNGAEFYNDGEWTGDTALYAWASGTSSYSDTAAYGYLVVNLDTANLALWADSVNYSIMIDSVVYSDTSAFADSAAIALDCIDSWSINGNSGTTILDFVGPTSLEQFRFGTNSNNRLSFGDNYNVYNGIETPGLAINGNRGFLGQSGTGTGLNDLGDSFVYFRGDYAAFAAGTSSYGLDTAMANNSFTFGENVGSNGRYSSVFGKNTYADSSALGAGWDAYACFASGRGNKVSAYGVAIGDSCEANYFRNVAIGYKARAQNLNSTVAIGHNVLSIGATSWAGGQNVTANGHYTLALGKNAHTDGFRGCFLWGDASTPDTVRNTAEHQFMVRASGGTIFYSSSDMSSGSELLSGAGSWSIISDRNRKENIILPSTREFTRKLESLNIYRWSYKNQNITHLGPMAQDLYQLFGFGERSNLINMVDYHGLTFAGIVMLNDRLDELDNEDAIDKLNDDIRAEEEELEKLKSRFETVKAELDD